MFCLRQKLELKKPKALKRLSVKEKSTFSTFNKK